MSVTPSIVRANLWRPVRRPPVRSVALVLLAGLAAGCGSPTPTAPSTAAGAAGVGILSAAGLAGLGSPASMGAFATAPETATLKVTVPTPQSPINDATVSGLRPLLSVTMSAGQYVEAPGLRLGFAIWQVGDDGGTTLIEAEEIPQVEGTTTYRVGSPLAHDGLYRWRSRAVLDGSFGPWSPPVTFRTPAPPPPPPPTTPPVPSDPRARYRAVFESDWSAATHPQDYPDNAHYSPLIGATHLATTTFWQSGMLASPGIERMAEEGSQSPLDGEMAAAIASGTAEFLFRGGGLAPTPGLEHVEFVVTTAFPSVTLVSMVAPSPDWFVGVSGLPLIANGQWRDEVVVPLFPWDAGTDNGASYDSVDDNAMPPAPISPLQSAPVVVNGSLPPFGRFIFRRLE